MELLEIPDFAKHVAEEARASKLSEQEIVSCPCTQSKGPTHLHIAPTKTVTAYMHIHTCAYLYIFFSVPRVHSLLHSLPFPPLLPLCPLSSSSVRRCSVRWIWRTRRPTCPALTSGAPRLAETTACHTCPAHYSTSSPKKRYGRLDIIIRINKVNI
jgi:hypothetical protein